MEQKDFPSLWIDHKKVKVLRIQIQKPWIKEEFWSFYAMRPFSIYLSTFLAKKTKVTPNMLTGLAILIGCISSVCYMFGTKIFILLGVFLYQLSYLLDCMDGEVARLTKRISAWGVWLDIGVHYTFHLVYFAAIFGILKQTSYLFQTMGIYLALLSLLMEIFVFDGFKLAFPNTMKEKSTEAIRKESKWIDGIAFFLFSFTGFEFGVFLGTIMWYAVGSPFFLLGWTIYYLFINFLKVLYKVQLIVKSSK